MGSGPSCMCDEGIRGMGRGNNARLIRGAQAACEHSERDDSRAKRVLSSVILGLNTYIALKQVR